MANESKQPSFLYALQKRVASLCMLKALLNACVTSLSSKIKNKTKSEIFK